MTNIYIPTESAEDWKKFLAEPSRQWKTGYSAKSIAECWEKAKPSLPPEIKHCLNESEGSRLYDLEMIMAIPEFKVPLPGGSRPSQTDVFALCKNQCGIVPVAVEGKVNESFGPTIEEQLSRGTAGVHRRMDYLFELLLLSDAVPGSIRYQLLHRTASALLIARDFHASVAVMLVHSFSTENTWFEDYRDFVALYSQEASLDSSILLGEFDGIDLFVGWAKGKQVGE